MDIDELKKRAWSYVEMEAGTEVISVEFIDAFSLFGRGDAVLLVKTTDPEVSEWWVVGGSTPINLYDKSRFDTPDEAFSFHTGIMMRIISKEYVKSDEIGYDAFISHASEDKENFVRPLADFLKEFGVRIWYDDFELEVGDSLRESIDKGLVNSRYGIVVLSPRFLDKNWTKYELNSLVAKEVEGEKVILPIWHQVTQEDIANYSLMLADKVALSSENMTIEEIAEKLSLVLAK